MEKFEGVHKESATQLYFGQLSETCQSITELDQTVVKNETMMFEDAVTDHKRLSEGAKRLLVNRKELLGQHQQAQADVAKGQAEATDREAEKKKELDDLSLEIKTQLEGFKANKSHEMRWALRELVRENIEYGQQLLSLWKDMDRQLDKTELT